jgi:hypothetical protein
MRRHIRHAFRPAVDGVEPRIAPSGLASQLAGATVQRLELENTLISNYATARPADRPDGGQQGIIAILIGL